MSPPFVVRPVLETDLANWTPIWDGYNEFYGRVGATALAEEITLTTWKRFFDPHEPVYALVAESDGRLVGLAHYVLHRSTTLPDLTCYLQDLFTARSARGHGVATALIDRVCERARTAGASRVYWHTHESNAAAMALYDRVADRTGFLVYRRPV